MSATRSPAPGTVAVVALFDGVFWRGCDSRGPIRCAPAAITSIETPYIYSPEDADR